MLRVASKSRLPIIAVRLLAIACLLSLGLFAESRTAKAASRTSQKIAYVNYDDSGFTESGIPSANIFADSIVGGPAPTSSPTASVTYNGMTFTPLTRAALSSTTLAPFDTLILFEVCDIGTSLTASQHTALNTYLAAGNKILLYDGDRCAPGTGGNADYSWFTFPFATSNPGPRGASGTLTVVENSTLTQGLASDPFSSDELGDANTATTSDPNWFAAAKTTNALGNNGYFLAYARNKGLIIYDGADHWFTIGPTKSLTDLFLNELNQQYDPDNLPGSVPIASCQLNLTPPQPVGAPKLTQLSCDPYNNTTSQHQTEVEPDTLAFGSTIVSAFQVGRFFDAGSDNIGWATSTDGGATWTHGFLPGTTQFATQPGTYEGTSDASVAYDAKDGVWMISWIGITAGNGKAVLVSLSSDGVNWNILPVTVATGVSLDKNWTVCDNTPSSTFYGHCYTEFDDTTNGDLIYMSTSINGGTTWLSPLSTAKSAHGLGGQPLVQPNGTVIVPYQDCGLFTVLDLCFGPSHIQAFTSLDGGGSWNAPNPIALIHLHHPAGNLRGGPLPSAEIDKSGTVYVVWSDCRFEGDSCSANDIVMSKLTGVEPKTGVTNWSAVQRIPIDPTGSGVDHFIPGLAIDSTTSGESAHLALTYYYYPQANCTTSTCQFDVGYISSVDGGIQWSSATQLAGPMQLSWLAQTSQGVMVGDYISTSISGGVAYPVFAVASAPAGNLLNEVMYTVGEQVVGPPKH